MPNNRSVDLRVRRWKYIPASRGYAEAWQTHIETGYQLKPQLYDLHRSPYEGQELSSHYPRLVHRLQKVLDKIVKQ